MKTFLFYLLLSTAFVGFSQDEHFQNSSQDLENQARELTDEYNGELAMTGKQQLLFQKKVEEFLIRKKQIQSNYSGKEKLDMLYGLQKEETAEMNDILTRPQLLVYERIKPRIQPLEKIKSEN